ncbi:protein NO VEIN-like [Rutidosis leptorrhynchoides]|uniref:protein NO VEIN-like n=1 Tax=Rutidosis leptorrhynchoides TaxID=125765 RepID=UPI003A9A23E7
MYSQPPHLRRLPPHRPPQQPLPPPHQQLLPYNHHHHHHHQTLTTQNPNFNLNPNPNPNPIEIMKSVINSGTLNSNWISSWLNALYLNIITPHSNSFCNSDNIIASLKELKFIPLFNGSYSSVNDGVIWLTVDKSDFIGFEKLISKIRVVDPSLFNTTFVENVTNMLLKIGVKPFSGHEFVKLVILPSICDKTNVMLENRELMVEYFLFIMLHLEMSCCNVCGVERVEIVSVLRDKAFVSTNDGYKRFADVAVHFGKEYGNLIDMSKLVGGTDMKWYEIDVGYLDHPICKTLIEGTLKWRKFFLELGVTDFVKIVTNGKRNKAKPENVKKNTKSKELKHLLSYVSKNGDGEKGKYFLEVLDSLWVDYFSDLYGVANGRRRTGCNLSIKKILQDYKWVASSMDDQLHFPKDLFYDCEKVRAVFGDMAPYAIPKVNNSKLSSYIGLKSTVTIDDALSVLESWRRPEKPFMASLSDMSKFYAYISKEMSISKQKIVGNLHSQRFIFFPYSFGSWEEVVSGLFLSPNEVYWHESIISDIEQLTKSTDSQFDQHSPFSKMLCNVYPDLHSFFVDEYGVDDNPPLVCYLQFLQQLSTRSLSSLAAKKTVFQVFQKWSERLDSGFLTCDDIDKLKKNMEEEEMRILPTVQDKWVSLHHSFGLVCWCDDDEQLKTEFNNLINVNFLCFGELNAEEKQVFQDKVSVLFMTLGITSISEAVTRDLICDGSTNNSSKTSLVRSVLPYAQCYVYNIHPNVYSELKLFGFKKLNSLKIVVVEKLFYKNVVKRFGIKSNKQHACSCLLQDNILYATFKCDSQSLFMELSRFLLGGLPELDLLKFKFFLDLITTMKDSGFTEERIESHVTNVQKLALVPNDELKWSDLFMSNLSSEDPNSANEFDNALKMKAFSQTSQTRHDVTQESIESNAMLLFLNKDEALKDQSCSLIDMKFSDMNIGSKSQSGTEVINGRTGEFAGPESVKVDEKSYDIVGECKDNSKIIEGIRRDEFGLNPGMEDNNVITKLNDRLGRALNCLSRDLYSQDSHFLLELVQNADDNDYPCDVEPTLTFILQETRVIVLNNEWGFSVENIKALCDIGNSTKKDTSAGYIGKKGIGFKSVFRVTDAPEIHSNGFHFKFDVTEGQIGFVMPTIVPPCDVDPFNKMVSIDYNKSNEKHWNTCIILPFKSNKNEDSSNENLISMFSDLRPSLLLFLHQLKCIKFKNLLNDSLIVMRKQIVGNGIVNVTTGKDETTWFVKSCKLKANHIRQDVETTEISIAFNLDASSDGSYVSKLDQQPVFAFLPLRDYGLKFIIQADFNLPSSREEVDGNSPWNKYLLSEFPNLFVSAELAFCNLPCFEKNPAKGVSVFLSFVPIVGEVHGFFSQLPFKIITKLRNSNCLLLEGDNDHNKWVPPSKVVRNWTEDIRLLLPDRLIEEHLGLGYLNKDTVLTDPLAQALHVEECGPHILIRIMVSLCGKHLLKSMGFNWLSCWLNVLFSMSNNGTQAEMISYLYQLPFIPLVDGRYVSIQEGLIWLRVDPVIDHQFEKLYTKIQMVDSELFKDSSNAENVTQMLYKLGVKRLSEHDILMWHVLPAICNEMFLEQNPGFVTELLSFIMFHLETPCPECIVEKENIYAHLRNHAFFSTNYGYKRIVDVPIHFSKEFGNLIDVSKLVSETGMNWFEIDKCYLEHPMYKSSPFKLKKFLQELGVTDFVRIVKVENCIESISRLVLKNMKLDDDDDYISSGSVVVDYDSPELYHLLAHVSSNCDREKSGALLKVVDTLWDEYFSDKLTGFCCNNNGQYKPFKSSVIRIFQSVRWLTSSIDDQLHFPNDLFHNCEAVHDVLGDNVPYAFPKVNNVKLINDIGLKSTVNIDDALSVLKTWTSSRKPLSASISQMSKFYTYLWNEMSILKQKIIDILNSEAFIFVPYSFGSTNELVSGLFLSPNEVYWHDSIVSSIKSTNPFFDQSLNFSKMLCNVYPQLHYFFVNEFSVPESPPLRSYLQFLSHLSSQSFPAHASNTVFKVFQKWSDGLASGVLSSDDIDYMKKIMSDEKMKILPTEQNKWVSLHESSSLVCWCNDEQLKKEFINLNNIHFLCFGQLTIQEKQMVQDKLSVLLRTLGICSLSKVVTREAIYDGLADNSYKTSLAKWALPYAQRYIYNIHPIEYSQLNVSEFDNLKIVVVEKLSYKNVIEKYGIKSNNPCTCTCLLQENVLYATVESDSHSLFMELSRFLIPEVPELHLANFLNLLTTMTKFGSTMEEIEVFIVNSQKLPNLPIEESQWSFESMSSPQQDSNWPPVHWLPASRVERTAPWVENGAKTKPTETVDDNLALLMDSLTLKDNLASQNVVEDSGMYRDTIGGFNGGFSGGFNGGFNGGFVFGLNTAYSDMNTAYSDMNTRLPSYARRERRNANSFNSINRDEKKLAKNVEQPEQVSDIVLKSTKFDYKDESIAKVPSTSTITEIDDDDDDWTIEEKPVITKPWSTLDEKVVNLDSGSNGKLDNGKNIVPPHVVTGKTGEQKAFKHFCRKFGKKRVRWVNEVEESGKPYDIVVEGTDDNKEVEYIEVKSTVKANKEWFSVTVNEWQFAVEKGESYSIACVVLSDEKKLAQVTVYNDPIQLCRSGKIQLAFR